jgi:hypothetical protein
MPSLDPERLLALLRDPLVESREIAERAGVPREEAGRATRIVTGISRATPEEVGSLPAPLAAAAARAALGAGRVDLLSALASHAGREVVKEAKRGLHVLRSRGVAVPEPPRPAPLVQPTAAPEPPLPAYASAVDGQGERAVWLARGIPGKGIEIGQAVLSDERGLVDLQVVSMGRKEWRAVVRGLLERGAAMGVAEVEADLVRSLVVAARALNERSGARVPDGADLWLAHLGPAAPPPDPALRFPPLPEPDEREALLASGALHDLPLLRGWLPDEPFLREIGGRLEEVAVSPLYLDDLQKREQMARIVAEAVDRSIEDAGRRARLAARLFAVADHLDRAGEAAHARAAASAARAVSAGAPARDVPFARRLVEKAFPLAPAEGRPAQDPATSLLVGPR